MEPLIQRKEVSQEIIGKIIKDLTCRYDARENIIIPQFLHDSNMAIQQLLLYSHTIKQLFPHDNVYPTQVLHFYHREIYQVIQLLMRVIKKMHNRSHTQVNNVGAPTTICSNCQHSIHHRNIKNIQTEILHFHRFSFQRLDQQMRCEPNQADSEDQSKMVISESDFTKKMGGLQKSLIERQGSLIECIDDFQRLKSNLLLEANKVQSGSNVHQFNLTQFISQITDNFMNSLRKIQDKIRRLRKQNASFEDKTIQTDFRQPQQLQNAHINQIININIKHEAEIKKMTDTKQKLQDTCKKYLLQLKQANAKIQTIEAQYRQIRDQLFSEKHNIAHQQKMVKNAEKTQEKGRRDRQEEQNNRRDSQGAQAAFNSNNIQTFLRQHGSLPTELLNITENLNTNDSWNRLEEVGPIIQAVFKSTLDRYTAKKTMTIAPIASERAKTKTQPRQSRLMEKRKEKMKMPFQLQNSRKSTRYQLRNSTINLKICKDVLNFKIYGTVRSQSQLSINSFQRDQKQTFDQHQKRRKLAKLSMFSNLKQLSQEGLPTTHFKKRRQSTQFNSAEQPTSNLLSTKLFKKWSKRNKSQEDCQSQKKLEQGHQISHVKVPIISKLAVRQFFFLDIAKTQPQKKHQFQQDSKSSLPQSKFMIQLSQNNNKVPKQKIVLNLQELNYSTTLFSLLAKVHLTNPNQYESLKTWIMSRRKTAKLKQDQKSDGFMIKKILSEIIFKHRKCHYESSLCPHLHHFLQSIEDLYQTPLENAQNTLFSVIAS